MPENPTRSGIDQRTMTLLNQSEALLERSRQIVKTADAAADRLRRIVEQSDQSAAVNPYRGDDFNRATLASIDQT